MTKNEERLIETLAYTQMNARPLYVYAHVYTKKTTIQALQMKHYSI